MTRSTAPRTFARARAGGPTVENDIELTLTRRAPSQAGAKKLLTLLASPSRIALFAALVWVVGCGGPGRVDYDGGRCLKDGRSLTVQEIESEEAQVAQRIASRQPWFTVITIGVVLVAAAGNADKALLLFRARHAEGHRPLAERVREMLLRQRENPVRFVALVSTSFMLIVLAGGAYIYLDIEKRASERALGMLQFCHLALRTQEEAGVLSEQRHNLEAIESTAGDIRSLVAKLPPDEQRKARLIVDEMGTALAKQGKLVGEYAARTDEAQKDLNAHTAAMEKGLASVEGELAELRSLPANVKDLESSAHRIAETTTSFDARFGDLRERVASVEGKVDTLLARPACSAPAVSSSPKTPASVAAAAPTQSKAPSAPTVDADAGKTAHAESVSK